MYLTREIIINISITMTIPDTVYVNDYYWVCCPS